MAAKKATIAILMGLLATEQQLELAQLLRKERIRIILKDVLVNLLLHHRQERFKEVEEVYQVIAKFILIRVFVINMFELFFFMKE